MGEAKRRQAAIGDRYGKAKSKIPPLKLGKGQKEKLLKWTVEGTIISLVSLAIWWLTFRLSGTGLG